VQVFLVRHAEAVDETLELRDPHRPLTGHGREQARALGDRLRWHDCHPTHIWSSPLVRAVQTAELVERGLDCMVPIDILTALAPNGMPRDITDRLTRIDPLSAVLIIGHEPSLSGIGGLLAKDPAFPVLQKAQAVRFVNGAVRFRFAWNDEAPTTR
jgi:phosphohistidine phosphatase